MSICVGFIITLPLEPLFRNILAELKYHGSYYIYIASEPYQAYQLYDKHADDVDFFILSGKMFLYTISCREDYYRKPCFALDGATTNIKSIILELLLENRNIDLSRIFIDAAYSDYHYLGIKDLLPPDQQPYFLDMSVPELEHAKKSVFSQETLESFMEYVYQKHLRLHREGHIDLSITRFGTLPAHFERLGIPYHYIYPTREYVINFIYRCLDSYRQNFHSGETYAAFVICYSPFVHNRFSEILIAAETLCQEYSALHSIDYNISQTENSMEVMMPAQALYLLTDNMQSLAVVDKLLQLFDPATTYSGIGIGRTNMEARFNAYTASEVGKGSIRNIYCVTEDGKITGPLGDHPVTIFGEPDLKIRNIAEKYGIDHRNLQKLISFAKISNSKIVTSEDISRYLQITRRSGNRILNKLVEHGAAIIYRDNMNGGKGRPKNCYELLFLDELENPADCQN